ncbi:MAG: NAD(P)-binding domain-containing protein [Corynebacterium sp.]|nr:NAD(P)-binding domain-containing protein [Corynebacterium sp.]
MKMTVLGTGKVGQTLAGALDALGHEVAMGTRNPEVTLSRADAEFSQWLEAHPYVTLLPYAEASARAEVVLNVTHGETSLSTLEGIGAATLAGKILLDLALPLDLSQGFPPTLTVANTDSLGEQVQRAFPETKVVKSLTSVFHEVMVEPTRIPGEHNLFIAGNDNDAKDVVRVS